MVYVTSDLHGYSLDKFKDFLSKVGFSDDDFLYILGDVIDRGSDGVRILKWLMLQPNVELLLGNHEAMLLACDFLFDEITEDSIAELSAAQLNTYSTWVSNSGQVTLDALSAMRNKEIQYILDYLRDAPLYEVLTVGGRDFVLVHSGLGGFRKDKKLSEYTPTDLLWTRPGLNTQYFDNITVIFGHTPTVCYGNEYLGKIARTDSFIDVDVGVGIGQKPALLRLDDMKELYYKDYKVNA
ncbi:MAG: metallophosphoesterase [Clostridia bacterium]|nr:metallophosphoesterase [Clostridia bacterium]